MKTLVSIIVACAFLAVAQATVELSLEQKAKLDKIKVECKAESRADENILKKMREGEFTDDPKLKEFLFCMSNKIGFQNDAGEIQEGVLTQKLGNAIGDHVKAKDLTDKCAKQTGSPSEISFKVVTCLYKSTPNHILIIH